MGCFFQSTSNYSRGTILPVCELLCQTARAQYSGVDKTIANAAVWPSDFHPVSAIFRHKLILQLTFIFLISKYFLKNSVRSKIITK